jgi:hypothetical protein
MLLPPLLYPPTHNTHCTYLKNDALQVKGHMGGPNDISCWLGLVGIFVFLLIPFFY